MQKIYYYVTLFPTEALIASMLTPEQFGAYMATGYKSGSHEQLIFVRLNGEFGNEFDWAYARKNTIPHEDGQPKHSLYLSIYRVLERIPLEQFGNLCLTTSDGRTLELESSPIPESLPADPYYLYQDLCPVTPLVISAFPPDQFGRYMVSEDVKIHLPALCFCDLRVIDINDPINTGNIGPMYDRNIGHLNECIRAVTERGKQTKMLERTFAGRFTFQIIRSGFAIFNQTGNVWYKMPDREELLRKHYNWGYSAMIL
jgi:hypothetical protein